MKNKIILIYPKLGPKGKEHRGVPLAVLSIAGALKSAGYLPEIIDLRVHNIKDINLDASVLWVGISSMTGYQIKSGLDVAEYVRKRNKDIPLVWGGWHPTLLPNETIQHPLVDIIVKGQGEITSVQLSNHLRDNLQLGTIDGIVHKRNGDIFENKNRPLEHINNFPPFAYDLIDIKKNLIYDPKNNLNLISYISSRGCPHRCTYCAMRNVYNRRWFALQSERVVGEIKSLIDAYKVDGIYFEDDEFFINKKRTCEISYGILKKNIKMKWTAIGRTDHIIRLNDEELKLIKDSGCVRVLVGAESGSQEILDLICKDTTIEQTVETVVKLEKHSIEPVLSFMVGFPVQNNDFEKTINLIKQLKKASKDMNIKLFFYTPYPGTEMYDYAIKHGFKAPSTLEEWGSYTMHKANTPWVTKNMEKKLSSFLFYSRFLNPYYPSKKGWKRALKKSFYKLFSVMSSIRIRYNFYAFPFERYFYSKIKI